MNYLSYPILLSLLTLLAGSLLTLLNVSYTRAWDGIFDRYIYEVLSFSLRQALFSSIGGVALGVLLTRSYVHAGQKWLKQIVEKVVGLPFILPTMVTIHILLHLFGHNGWARLPFSLYSESGIVLTHIVLNVPFVLFLMRQAWEDVPHEHWRLAKHLGFSSWQFWRIVEWPVVRNYLSHAFIPVFLLCFTSFTPVLILSPQPADVTLEVAIYQAFMFEMDLENVVGLVLLQLAVGSLLFLLLPALLPFRQEKTGFKIARLPMVSQRECWTHNTVLYVMLVALALAAGSLIQTSLQAPFWKIYTSHTFLVAVVKSTSIAFLAGFLCTLGAIGLVRIPFIQRLQSYISILPAVIPSVTLGAGLYMFIGQYFPDLSLIFVVFLNAIMGLPFALRILQGALHSVRAKYADRVIETRLTCTQQWKLVELPLLLPSLRLSFGLVSAISFGDLGSIILFSGHEAPTLAALMYHYLEIFDMQASACIALALIVCTAALFMIIQNVGADRAQN